LNLNYYMIYPSDFESKIGFDALRARISEKTLSDLGVSKCMEMSFSCDGKLIKEQIRQTAEMLDIIKSGKQLPIDNLYDPLPFLNQIKSLGSHLSAPVFYKLMKLLITVADIRAFFCGNEDESTAWESLARLFADIPLFPTVIRNISDVINEFGEVKDTASPQLAEIRRAISSVSSSLSGIMRRVIDRAVGEGVVESDTSPALRDGRFVIPVSASMKRKISGIVHDQSATGKTYFIEPAEIVESNNRLRELQMDERKEIIRILVELSDFVRPYIPEIESAAHLVGLYDFIRAKALFALETDGEMPHIEDKPAMEWFHAIHPMLLLSLKAHGRKAVPLDITLTRDKRILIISGPNAGGKSVCLKTVGCVQYMMQCGLLPPLYSNSRMGIYDKIFIDIGDEQSIENDLSTYSSHLRNMKYFLSETDSKTLILADEMGSGTEPQIGGALAQAILAELNKRKPYGVITTHYQNLKTFASSEPGFVNGAMMYDRQHLQPMFKLSIGNPGSSFALDIARKSGLPLSVIDNAKEIVGSDMINLDKYILDIARDRKYWEQKRLNIKEKDKKLERLSEEIEEKLNNLKSSRSEIISDARKEARRIMDSANSKIENAIRQIKDADAEKERTKQIRQELKEYRESISSEAKVTHEAIPQIKIPEKYKKHKSVEQNKEKKAKKEVLKAGDYVKMSDGGSTGKILSIKNDRAEVLFGSLRTFVSLQTLKPAAMPKATAVTEVKTTVSSDDSRRRQLNFKQEIDVRGFRADEALQAVMYFIDDAVQFGATRVRILHGTGTGALRVAIRGWLQSSNVVSSFHDEDVRFGGAGITVVNLE
jgi:DNA mismatch repair protein MutS2